MKNINGKQSAFARPFDPHVMKPLKGDSGYTDDDIQKLSGGLTKREYFTAQAIQGLLANSNNLFNITPNELREIALARCAVEIADAVLNALEK